jgi:hypothetical protein
MSSLIIKFSDILKDLPHYCPDRFMGLGEGYKKINGGIYMSIYYFKHLHDLDRNTAENNAKDSSFMGSKEYHYVKSSTGQYENIRIFPIHVLDDFYNVNSSEKLKEYNIKF